MYLKHPFNVFLNRCICIFKYIRLDIMNYGEFCLNIGLKIKFFRQQQHMTQSEFAEKLEMDVRYLSDIERGKKNFTLKTLHKISTALNINPIELFVYTRNNQD